MKSDFWKIISSVFFVFASGSVSCQVLDVREINEKIGASSNFINDIAQDEEGRVVFATDNGLATFNGVDFNSLVSGDYISLVRYADARIYFTVGNQLFAENKKQPLLTLGDHQQIVDLQFLEKEMLVLSQGTLYRTVNNEMIDSLELNEVGVQLVVQKDRQFLVTEYGVYQIPPGGLSNLKKVYSSANRISCLMLDGENAVVATDKGWEMLKQFEWMETISGEDCVEAQPVKEGYLFISKESIHILRKDGTMEQLMNPQFMGHDIHGVFIDRDHGWWFKTRGKGCYFVSTPGISMDQQNYFRFPNEDVYALCHDGNVRYFATKDGCFSEKNGQASLVTSKELFDIVVHEGVLYGTTRDEGVFCMDLQQKSERFLDISSGLSHNFIRSISIMGDTLIAIPKNGEVNFIAGGKVIEVGIAEYLEGLKVQNIAYLQQTSKLYLLTISGELHVHDRKTSAWATIQPRFVGRSLKQIEDQLWIVGNDRLGWLNNEVIHQFQLPESLIDDQMINGGVMKGGSFILPFSGGNIRIHKEGVETVDRSPKLVITSVQLNERDIEYQPKYALGFGTYRFRMGLELIDLRTIGDRPLHWKVRGAYSNDAIVRNEFIELLQMSEGLYEVSVWTNGGVLMERVTLTIAPPFWKSIWFWIFLLLGIVLSVWFIVRWRVRKLSREQQRLERLVEKKTAELSERNKDVEQIAYAISHDFKTPLNTVHELVQLQLNPTISEEQRSMSMQLVSGKTEQLLNNMSGLIQLLKIGANEQEWGAMLLSEVLHEVKASLDAQIQEKKASVHEEFEAHQIEGIRPYIFSILHNLIANALKYQRKGIPPEIVVQSKEVGGAIQLSISDNGLGMDMSKHGDHILRPFRQINGSSEGVGLGLSIVKRMIDVHQGQLFIDSTLGHGTRFTIELPIIPQGQ